jgi:general nucleoside transport system permease protein
LETISVILFVIQIAIVSGVVITLAAMGELMAELTGMYNMGLEGIMAMGAVIAVLVLNKTNGQITQAVIGAIAVGVLMGMLFAFATVVIQANQVLCGLALTFIGTGLSGVIGGPFAGKHTPGVLPTYKIPFLGDIPYLGDTFFNHNLIVYFCYLILPFVVSFVIYNTRHGMNMRSIGVNPAAADASGIQVKAIRFFYVTLGAALAGMGGAYLTLALSPTWQEGIINGRGWIALALVIFARWKPFNILWGALLFGGVISIGYVAQARNWGINAYLLSMLPYLSTVIIMIVPIALMAKARRRLSMGPSALGAAFFRDEG